MKNKSKIDLTVIIVMLLCLFLFMLTSTHLMKLKIDLLHDKIGVRDSFILQLEQRQDYRDSIMYEYMNRHFYKNYNIEEK